MAINKTSPIPLYFQLAEHLRGQIELGQLRPGEQLPSERELGEQWHISRMTARQAIMYLVRQGRLLVRPGIGTFVAEPKLTHDTLHLLGFTEEMLRSGQAPSSQVLEQSLAVPPARVAADLNLAAGQPAVKIVRLRLSHAEPLLLETVFVPAHLAPGLEHLDLSQASLYALLEQPFELALDHARQSLEVTAASEDEALLFGIPAGTSMLVLEGVTYTADEQPVEAFKALYLGQKFTFTLESQRDNGLGASQPRLSVVLRGN
ncbi:MAG: GntR family transcriptional regulator [Anaerolineales bacterium]